MRTIESLKDRLSQVDFEMNQTLDSIRLNGSTPRIMESLATLQREHQKLTIMIKDEKERGNSNNLSE